MRMKRLPLLGAITIILIIILLPINSVSCSKEYVPQYEQQQVEIIPDTEQVEEICETEEADEIEEVEEMYVYNITQEEREMLARLVFLEANTESIDCQKAIVSVVINRWQNGYWGNTLHDVVYAKGQFTPASKISRTTPTSTNYEAVDYVIQYGTTLPEYVLYFRTNYHFNWRGYSGYTHIDNTYFGYMKKDKTV